MKLRKLGISSLAVAAMFAASTAFGASAYVSSLKATLHKDAKASAKKMGKLRRGQKLTVLSKKGTWLQVKAGARKGWVKKFFTSSRKPGAKFSVLGNASANARVHARKRASSDVTAASARGLDDEDNAATLSRGRELSNAKNFNPQVLSEMESLFVSEDDLSAFLKDGGLQ